MRCERKNCKIRGHENIFVFLSILFNENSFLLLKEIFKNVILPHKKIIDIFEFSKNDFDINNELQYFKNLKYMMNIFSFDNIEGPNFYKLCFQTILYPLLDMKGVYSFRTQKKTFNKTCYEVLDSILGPKCENKNLLKILKNIFEKNKKYFLIKKNQEHMYKTYRTLFFIKCISPIKDTERNIAKFLIES
jgi:hypothetical protein